MSLNSNASSQHYPVDRKESTDSGMDNPFRPGSELSREADIIVNLIKEGKPITPTKDTADFIDSPIKASNATNAVTNSTPGGKGINGTPKSQAPGVVEVQHGIVVPPNDASQVVEEVMIKKKRKCCTIQ